MYLYCFIHRFKSMTEISIIIPIYNEESGLRKLHERLSQVMDSASLDYEIIFVNDGSRDNSKAIIEELMRLDVRARLISLSRNFGKEQALTAGIDYCTGKAVIPLDADLQDPPELIPQMVEKWREGYKIVAGKRKSRPGDSWFKNFTAHCFYKIINRVSTVQIPENTGDFRLIDRQAVDSIKSLRERTRFMKGIFAWVGFSTYYLEYDRPARLSGTSSWNYRKLWSFALDGIFSFTTTPLKIWPYLGACIAGFSFIYAIFLILYTATKGVDVPGYTSIMVTVLFMGGVQLISLGVIGEYIGRIYRETKNRPLYVVEETAGFDSINHE